MKLLLMALSAVGLFAGADERRTAEWIIRQGGQVMLDGGEPIGAFSNIPETDFRITGINLYGTPTTPRDMERLSGLTELRELYLSSKTYSPSSDKKGEFGEDSFQFLAKLTKLEKLHVSLHFLPTIDITDAAWRHMSGHSQLKELRLALTRITKAEVLAPFVNLHSLDLSQAYVSNDAMIAVGGMTALKRLNLAGTQVTEPGVLHLRNLTNLEDLDLTGIPLTDSGLEAIRSFTRLQKLSLQGAAITDAGMEILMGFPELRELNLYRTKITNAGLQKLAKLTHLTAVDLRYSSVTRAGAARLMAALPNCRLQFVDGAPPPVGRKGPSRPSGTGEAAVAAWIKASGGSATIVKGRIDSVSLGSTLVNDEQMRHLGSLAALKSLSLEATELSDLGLASIARLKSLEDLNLGATMVSDRGMAHLSGLVGLRRLRLSDTKVSGEGLKFLESLPALTDLDLKGTAIDSAGMALIEKLTSLERLKTMACNACVH